MPNLGFRFEYYIGGTTTPQLSMDIPMVDALSMDAGDMAEITTGEVDYGATNSTTLYGVCAETVDNAADGETMRLIIAKNAVFSVEDSSARVTGEALDINGTYDGVTTNSNSDVMVVKPSSTSQRTFVMVLPGSLLSANAT